MSEDTAFAVGQLVNVISEMQETLTKILDCLDEIKSEIAYIGRSMQS